MGSHRVEDSPLAVNPEIIDLILRQLGQVAAQPSAGHVCERNDPLLLLCRPAGAQVRGRQPAPRSP